MTQSIPEAITLFLCGDVMTGRGIDQVLPHPSQPEIFEPCLHSARDYVALAETVNGPLRRPVEFAYPWGDALAVLAAAAPDVRLINLETSITTSAYHWPDKDIHYRMHPANLPCLTAAGIDVCALANNHVLDWGHQGLTDTLATLRQGGIATVGAGRDVEEARAPAIVDLAGKGRVLVFAFGCESSGIPPEWAAQRDAPGVALLPDLSGKTLQGIADRVRMIKRPGDVAVASIHWGGNWGYAIPASHRTFARGLIDTAGVDIVHGHSSHHPMGLEIYRHRPIFYGCGDLLNDYEGIGAYESYRADLALMYFVTLNGDGCLRSLELVPLQRRRFRLCRASPAQAEWLRQTVAHGSIGLDCPLGIDAQGRLHWKRDTETPDSF